LKVPSQSLQELQIWSERNISQYVLKLSASYKDCTKINERNVQQKQQNRTKQYTAALRSVSHPPVTFLMLVDFKMHYKYYSTWKNKIQREQFSWQEYIVSIDHAHCIYI
jgi:hypothetical protein